MNQAEIRDVAVSMLLSQRFHRLPVNPKTLCRGDIRCDTMGSFCSKTRMTMVQLTKNAGTHDGFTLALPGGNYLILYNERQTNRKRQSFTIAHELGHIVLGHSSDMPQQEQEANCFAAELLMPRILIWELRRRKNISCSATELSEVFGVSQHAAKVRLHQLSGRQEPFSETEYQLLKQYGEFFPSFEYDGR